MTLEELLQLITEVQRHQSELDDIEVKSARGGIPQRLLSHETGFKLRIMRYARCVIREIGDGFILLKVTFNN
jgi:hypothetical protein